MKIGTVYQDVEIIDYTHEGLGVAKVNDFVTFIPFVNKGNKYKIKITKVKKKFAYAIALNGSINNNGCKYFPKCGGCQIRHLDIDKQLEFKQEVVNNILNKNKIKTKVLPIIGSDSDNYYRNKVIMPVKWQDNKITKGYYKSQSHDLVSIDSCKLVSDEVNDITNYIIELLNEFGETAYDEDKKKGNVRYICIRQGYRTNQIMVCLVCYYPRIKEQKEFSKRLVKKFKNIKSIVINQNNRHNNAVLGFKNINLYNCNFIEDKIGDLVYRIEPNTFFQVNTNQAKKLYDIVIDFLNPNKEDIVLDAYCGVGTIGLYFAKQVKRLVGSEINAKSVKMAEINAKINNIDNAEFICVDMQKDKSINYNEFNKIVVDPPRSGLSTDFINILNKNNFETIVYVSCNPATMARDLKHLENSYQVKKIQPVDMFSHTYHVENVVLLERK